MKISHSKTIIFIIYKGPSKVKSFFSSTMRHRALHTMNLSNNKVEKF